MALNESTAELIGMHVGDGSLYKTSRGLVWELRGSLEEQNYYLKNVKSLIKMIFDLELEPKFRSGGKNGCFGIQTSKKDVTRFFLESEFKPGNKTYTVKVPEYIMNSNKKIKLAFMRGLFDTDGCIRFDRINKQIFHTYPRIEFCFASNNLRDGLFQLTRELGFHSFKWDSKDFKLAIGGKEQTKLWFDNVKPNNTKHLNKYEFWQKWGYNMPRSHSPVLR